MNRNKSKLVMKKKGKFIVFDGSDGSGKQTQVELLTKYFARQKRRVRSIDFPQYTNNFHGKILKAALKGDFGDFISLDPYTASFLYTADRFESARDIRKNVDEGRIVIADRFTTANMIHQGGKFKNKTERDKYLKWLLGLEFNYLKLPKPDLAFFLQVPVSISLKLLKNKKGKDLAEKSISYLKNSLACARAIANKYGWIMINCAPNGLMRSRESINDEIVRQLKKHKIV